METTREELLKTRLFSVARHTYSAADGSIQTRDIVEHPGAVVIVPMVDADHVALIRNFRIAAAQTLIELPAGTLEAGEEPLETAARELTEETGYQAARLEKLHEFFISPGVLNEKMHLYLATGLTPGRARLQPGEEIQNLITPWDEAMAMIRSGKIRDAKTLVGLMYCDRFCRPLPSRPD